MRVPTMKEKAFEYHILEKGYYPSTETVYDKPFKWMGLKVPIKNICLPQKIELKTFSTQQWAQFVYRKHITDKKDGTENWIDFLCKGNA